jgi:hypothetical protein
MAQVHMRATPRILILQQNGSIGRLIREVGDLEGIQTVIINTADQAYDFLASPDSEHPKNGRDGHQWVMLIDNLQVSTEGQEFLVTLRDQPGVRARLKTVCVAAVVNCEWARTEYGDVLDEYLVMPFGVKELFDVIGIDLRA